MNSRLSYIDISKGIGIFLVVLGHNDQIFKILFIGPILGKMIFSFHMPLFFFLSGVIYDRNCNFVTLLKKRYNSLIKPYWGTVFLFLFTFGLYSPSHNHMINIDISLWVKIIFGALYSTGPYLFWAPLWFLTCLFMTQLLFSIINKQIFFRYNRIWFRLIFMILLLTVGYSILKYFKQWNPNYLPIELYSIGPRGLPWNIDLLFVTVFYFYLGFEFRNIEKYFVRYWKKIFFPLLILFIFLNVSLDDHLNLNTRSYDGLITNTLEAIIGINLVVSLAKLIESFNDTKLKNIFIAMGSYSLIILIFHWYLQAKIYNLANNSFLQNELSSSLIALLGGVIGPIILYERILKKIPIIKVIYSAKT